MQELIWTHENDYCTLRLQVADDAKLSVRDRSKINVSFRNLTGKLEGKLTDASGPVPLQVTTEDNLVALKANLLSPLSPSELEHLLVCMRRMLFMTHKYREEGDLEWLL